MQAFVHHPVRKSELPTLDNQNSQKNRQKGLTNKKRLYIFLQKNDVTENDSTFPRLRFTL